MKEEEKDQLIVEITKLIWPLQYIEESTIKQKIAMARHIANMPKKARIIFINALIVVKIKSSEYDEMQSACESNNTTSCTEYANPEWNK